MVNDWEIFRDWEIYLHARQLYIETGDTDALANMIEHVTERDLNIPDRIQEISWHSPVGPESIPAKSGDLRCY